MLSSFIAAALPTKDEVLFWILFRILLLMKIERDWNKFLMYEVLFIPLDNAKIIKIPFLFKWSANVLAKCKKRDRVFYIERFFAWGL
jgi:hypothetical protein